MNDRDLKIEELANELFLTVTTDDEENDDQHRLRVYQLLTEVSPAERQRANMLARGLLAEHHAIQRANLRLNR